MRATPQDAAKDHDDRWTLDDTIAELKAMIQPGYWGELGIRLTVKDGIVTNAKTISERSRKMGISPESY